MIPNPLGFEVDPIPQLRFVEKTEYSCLDGTY